MDTPTKPTSSDLSDECNSDREDLSEGYVLVVADPECALSLLAETTTEAPLLDYSNRLTEKTPTANLETEQKPILPVSTEEEGTETPPQSESHPGDEMHSDGGSDDDAYDVNDIDFGYGSSEDGDNVNEAGDNANDVDNSTDDEDNNTDDDDDAWDQIWGQVGATDDAPLLEYPFSKSQHHPLPEKVLLLVKKYLHSRADLLQFMLTCKMAVSVLCKDIWEQPVISSLESFKLLSRTAVESRVLQSFPFFNIIHTIKIDSSVPIGDDELFDMLERCQNLQVLDLSGNQNVTSTSISQ
ncbi:hypothetical protein HDU81_010989, partial [Chytriomyces hyalinus]